MPPDTLDRIKQSLHHLEASLASPLEMRDLAVRAGYSVWHYQRLFAAIVGEPPGSYLRRRRLTEAAKRLLGTPRERILDIALDYQFESHEAFTRAFCAVAGLSPTAFRRQASRSCQWQRPALRLEHLQLPEDFMDLKPTPIRLPDFQLIGYSAPFIAAVSPDSNNLQVIPPLWQRFGRSRAAFGADARTVAFGACRPRPNGAREDELDYLAGLEYQKGQPKPEGAVIWNIPAAAYIRFTHVGPVETFGATLNQIFGNWFPRSEYELDLGTELERYDHRFVLGSRTSELDYFVPCRRRDGRPACV